MTEPQPVRVFYFGCLDEPGHFFWESSSRLSIHSTQFPPVPGTVELVNFDGKFTPSTTREQGKAALHHRAGWTVLAWHDYTCDRRPGSNSAILAIGTFGFEQMLSFLQTQFSTVYNRQTVPLALA